MSCQRKLRMHSTKTGKAGFTTKCAMIYAYLRHARRLLRCFGFRVLSSGLAERTLNFELLNLETLRIRRPGIRFARMCSVGADLGVRPPAGDLAHAESFANSFHVADEFRIVTQRSSAWVGQVDMQNLGDFARAWRHDDHPVAQENGFRNTVGDEQNGFLRFVPDS